MNGNLPGGKGRSIVISVIYMHCSFVHQEYCSSDKHVHILDDVLDISFTEILLVHLQRNVCYTYTYVLHYRLIIILPIMFHIL